MARKNGREKGNRQVGYAVIGLGHIAQAAVLPAFAHAHNAKLVAVVSGDAQKRARLARKYRCDAYDVRDLDEVLDRPDVDAVYVAEPNDRHVNFGRRQGEGTEVQGRRSVRPGADGDSLRVVELQGQELHQTLRERSLRMDLGPSLRTDLRQIVRSAQLRQSVDEPAVPLVVVLDRRCAYRSSVPHGHAPAARQDKGEDEHDALHRFTSAKATSLPSSSSSSCIARPSDAQVTYTFRGA